MVDIGQAIVTTLTGLIGVIIGASAGHYINHKIAKQEGRKETLFKKKLEYFEHVLDTIIKNTQLYKNEIKKLEKSIKKKEILNILQELKKSRMKFEIMSSPLYFDTRVISNEIKHFVNIEKAIFYEITKMTETKEPQVFLVVLKGYFEKLNELGRSIISKLKVELAKS